MPNQDIFINTHLHWQSLCRIKTYLNTHTLVVTMPNQDIFINTPLHWQSLCRIKTYLNTHTLVVTMPNQDILIHNTHARARTHIHIHPHTLNTHTHARAREKTTEKETGLPHWPQWQIANLDVNRKQQKRVLESDGERRVFICTHVRRPSLLLTQALFDTVPVCGVETATTITAVDMASTTTSVCRLREQYHAENATHDFGVSSAQRRLHNFALSVSAKRFMLFILYIYGGGGGRCFSFRTLILISEILQIFAGV